MGFKRVILTQEEFDKVQLETKHYWEWLGAQSTGGAKKLKCRCKICKTDHWVFWRWIRLGRSTRCQKCSKRPSINVINNEFRMEGIWWRITHKTRTSHKKNGQAENMRQYQCLCTSCNTYHWVRWQALRLRKSKSCKGCSMRFKIYGHYKPDPVDERYLRRAWANIRRHPGVPWEGWEAFRDWSRSVGYELGGKIARKVKNKRHSPENSYFIAAPIRQIHSRGGLGVQLSDNAFNSSPTSRVG